ncbi:MAG: hypothetical protein IPH34_15035 [Chitinophagaceae bacterium]|nr:hypothetical protein [Chitinophagaceae bacterium]MBP6476264.1 hypothetical protein [Chitinophagaceae bacterium]MBP7108061.1 hypothetical protein [Chitinophagaceae bacterium]MBP7313635.1 hypothetical protein [Chitinophagaceae bacterium]HQX98029.1 hypothetical protein [Chitinophagaceae bacterium]
MNKALLLVAIFFSLQTNAQPSDCINEIKENLVAFSKKSVFLNAAAKKKIDSVVIVFKKNIGCRIVITSYGNNCLTCQQTSWDRGYSVIKYLRQIGIDSTRIIMWAAQNVGDPLTVLIRPGLPEEDGPSLVEPYIPCYSYHSLTKKRCKGSRNH